MSAKKNSLKVAPFATRRQWVIDKPREEWPEYNLLLEYTYGKPGDQKSDGFGAAGGAIDWRPNEPFTDTLTIDRLERGRSAARFWFIGTDGTHYPFFGQGLTDMLKQVAMVNGSILGTFIVVKRGTNYGIELVTA